MAIKKTTSQPSGLAYQTETRDREQIAADAQTAVSAPTRYTTPNQYTSAQDFANKDPEGFDAWADQQGWTNAPLPTRYTTPPTITRPTGPTPVDENGIREDVRKRMQSSVDAINAQYANLIAQEKVLGEDRTGQTRAINARSGLIGSDFGNTNQQNTTEFNKQQEKFLKDEQNAKIQSVLMAIEDRASTEIATRKAEALGQYERDMDAFRDAQDQARADFKLLAESGVDLNTLNPAQKAALLKQSGYDNQFGELIYNAMKPKPKQIDYKFEKLADGRGMFYGVDPQTGELKRIDVSVDLPPDWQMQIAPDGTVIGYDKNSGEARVLSDQGQFADPFDRAYKQAQIEKIYADIANGQGAELLSPSDAKTLGVPYGTTKNQAAQLGIIPSGQLSAAGQQLKANATSGLNSLKTIKRELFGDENKNLNQPGDIRSNIILRSGIGMAREYTSATKEMMDILVRLRTGAAISENEEKFYKSQLPTLTDNEQTVRAKLKRFEDLFNNLSTQAESTSNANDLFQEFEGGGSGFKPVGSDTHKATGMRTDRHNNPAAFTTDIAKQAGLVLGKDYTVGDAFPNNPNLRTAKLIGNPVDQTIKVIDRIGFYTQSGAPRWTYVPALKGANNWSNLSYDQKKNVVAQMYQHEGGSQLKQYFA